MILIGLIKRTSAKSCAGDVERQSHFKGTADFNNTMINQFMQVRNFKALQVEYRYVPSMSC